jgi:manganese/iron transport system permease protein
MQELMQLKLFQNAVIACIFGGGGLSIMGVFMILMEMPFLGISMSHSAFLGAICGMFFGFNPLLGALIVCAVSGMIIGPMADKTSSSTNNILAVIFTSTMGLAFLLLAFVPGPKSEALNLIWGSILTISDAEIILLLMIVLISIMLIFLFYKEISAVIFNRELARSSGIPEKFIYYAIIFITGMIISASLDIVGGLLLFSLLINPSSAAKQLSYNLKTIFILAALFGIIACFSGLLLSYLFDIPTGAVIVLSSTCIYILCAILSPKKQYQKQGV